MAAMVEITRSEAQAEAQADSVDNGGAHHGTSTEVEQSDAAGFNPGRASAVHVSDVPESDWEIWRDLRLEALADAPYAFGETLARAQSKTEEDWRAWWRDEDGPGPRYFGLVDGAPAGMCGICFPEDMGREPLIIGMWTSPRARGRGVGRAMLDACVKYCETAGHRRLLLGVVDDNLPARRLYETHGFVETGESEPLHWDPSKLVIMMAKELNAL